MIGKLLSNAPLPTRTLAAVAPPTYRVKPKLAKYHVKQSGSAINGAERTTSPPEVKKGRCSRLQCEAWHARNTILQKITNSTTYRSQLVFR
jgi:hypothetical protein